MRLLFLCHAHPQLQTGGTEIFSADLFRALRQRPGVEAVFLAGSSAGQRPSSPGTAFQAAGATNELLLRTEEFDSFFLSQIDLHGVMPALTNLLNELRPDIVHIHHLLTLGVEVIALIRRVAPQARIVMTLHDYYSICAHDGQMVTTGLALCHGASLDACHRCMPDRSHTDFRLRELSIRRALQQVDAFIAPSRFLRERFIAWGLPAHGITVLSNGMPDEIPASQRPALEGRRDRFGFFGHINRFKGAILALSASTQLSRSGVAHVLALHGGTAHQSPEVLAGFHQALQAAPDARHLGAYDRADLRRLISAVDWVVVPSIWWENAPLVIQEAFRHRRPVITADIGGMAEAVRDGVDGLHAAVGDVASFARVMHRAAEEHGLWDRLVKGILPPTDIAATVDAHRRLYERLMAGLSADALIDLETTI